MSGKFGLLIASLALGMTASAGHSAAPAAGSYLFVWAGDEDEKESDFLAVIDTDATSTTYGKVVATAPVGIKGTMPHHVEYEPSNAGTLFVNGWKAGHTFILDIADPLKPRLVADFKKAGDYSYPHSFARLPNGNVLATFQSIGEEYAPPGGVVELDSGGRLVRASPSQTPDIPNPINWPYSLVVHPALDRVVTTSTDMGMGPGWKSPETNHVQVWSMSELKLLATVPLPESGKGHHHGWPAEPRTAADGTVYVNTFTCGLYRLDALDTPEPRARFVHAFPGGTSEHDMCAVPVIYGKYWVQTVGATNGLIVLDISDPEKPVEVSRLTLPASFHMPHWAAADRKSGRIAVTGAKDSWVLMLKFDDRTGMLSIDETFGSGGRADFDGQRWPHGDSGRAIVHGAVFRD